MCASVKKLSGAPNWISWPHSYNVVRTANHYRCISTSLATLKFNIVKLLRYHYVFFLLQSYLNTSLVTRLKLKGFNLVHQIIFIMKTRLENTEGPKNRTCIGHLRVTDNVVQWTQLLITFSGFSSMQTKTSAEMLGWWPGSKPKHWKSPQ